MRFAGGKSHRPINEASLPLTAAMVAKMKTAALLTSRVEGGRMPDI